MEPAVNSWARPARNITACVLIAQPTKSSSHHETRLLLLLLLLFPLSFTSPSVSLFCFTSNEKRDPDRVVWPAPSQQQHTSCNNLLFLPF
jgi:hypothetical protein